MVTVTMAIAAIPIHVATRAGWIPDNDNDGDYGNDADEDDENDEDDDDNDDDDDDDDWDRPARGGEEMEQEVRRGEQEQECSSWKNHQIQAWIIAFNHQSIKS